MRHWVTAAVIGFLCWAAAQAELRSGFGRTAGGEPPALTREQAFAFPGLPWSYPNAVWRPGTDDVYGICASGVKIATCVAEPANGLTCGVLTGVYWNHNKLDTSYFELRTAFGHQFGDCEILIRRFGYGGQVDTVTEWLVSDETITAGWIPLWAFQHQHALANTEYSTVLGAMSGADRTAEGAVYYRTYTAFPRIEFLDSCEVWMRSAAGSHFNDLGGAAGMQKLPLQTVYFGVDYALLPSRSELHGRRMVTQARLTCPRNFDLSVLARTPLGRKGFVWGLSLGMSPGFTLATNDPWQATSPYAIDHRKFPDHNLDYSMLEENQLFWFGDSLSGGPVYGTLRGAHASGGSTIRINKPDSTRSWGDYVPPRARDLYRDEYYMFVVRDGADPMEGGGCFVSKALTDCTSYWLATIEDIVGEVTGGTFDQTYQSGDTVLLVSGYWAQGTGSEDFPHRAGFYIYNALHQFNWGGYNATKYTDVTYDSVLVNAATGLPVIGSAARGMSMLRIFGSGDHPAHIQFGPNERFTWGILKAKDFQNPHNLGLYSWRITAAMSYGVDDGPQWYAPPMNPAVIADTIWLWKGYVVDNNKTVVSNWAQISLDADSQGSGVDSVKTISGQAGLLDYIGLNLTTGSAGLHRPIFVFDSKSGVNSDPWTDELTDSTHKVQDSVALELFPKAGQWGANWLSGAHFAKDSSWLGVVDLSEIPNYTTVSAHYLKFYRGEPLLDSLKISAYQFPPGRHGLWRYRLPAYTVREGFDTKLGLLWTYWDSRNVAPAVADSSSSNLIRLYVPAYGYPDPEWVSRLIVYSHAAAGAAPPDTFVIRFSWFDANGNQAVDAGESWVKDIHLRSDTPTSNRDADNPHIAGYVNSTPDRTFRLLCSLREDTVQAGRKSPRDSLRGLTIVSATCSLLVASYDSSAARNIYGFPVRHSSARVTWTESQATWNARATGTNWQSAGGDIWTDDTLVTWSTNLTLPPGPTTTTNEWLVLDITSLVDDMATLPDSVIDGFALVASGAHPDTVSSRIGFQPSDTHSAMSPNQVTMGAVSNEGAVIWTIIAVAE